MTHREELIKILKEIDIVYRESVELKHGDVAEFYVDVKKAYGYPNALNLICDGLWEKINKTTTCIATEGYGGVTPASVLSSRYNLNLTLVRKEPKKHGKISWIDGYVPTREDRVSVIDDVLTTGGSLSKIIQIVKLTGAEVLGSHVVVKRGYANLEVPMHYLLTVEDLL